MANVYTIPPSANFAQTLATGLIAQLGPEPLALADAVIYLPTRRAQRTFGDAFARVLGGAALLPRFKALGDVDEDDLLFDEDALILAPAVAPMRRTLLLAAMVQRWHRGTHDDDISFAQAAALAEGLAQVMDEVETQGASLANLNDVVPNALAAHWEQVRDFLLLLETQWPAILQAESRLSPADRRNQALTGLAERIARRKHRGPVIAAGSTGSIPATATLLKAIANLRNGSVVLPGLDRELDEASWRDLDPGHPQYGLKQLLGRLNVKRHDVKDWSATGNPPRERALREALRPAPTTDAWRGIADAGDQAAIGTGLSGLSLMEAADPAEEAAVIAIVLREALESPGKTATLVTPDRALARRVAAELRRWHIDVDDSAGRPLARTPPGTFLCLLAEAADAGFAPVELLALLKHPLCAPGGDGAFRGHVRTLDRLLRGPRPNPGLDGIREAILKRRKDEDDAAQQAWLSDLLYWFADVHAALKPLETTFRADAADLIVILRAHLAAAEALAGHTLWRAEAGEVAARFIEEFATAADGIPPVAPRSYAALFRRLALDKAVRQNRSGHPRVAILGPLEARLQSFDTVVLGGLNEGAWPRMPGADPWFSRPMRAALGLEQPERSIGQSAHDFAMLAAGPRVLLTRALKAEGAPTVASRWVQRLEQFSKGLGLKDALKPPCDYIALAKSLRDAGPAKRMAKPAPRPPLEARPNRMPVTDIETWVRDPYAIYAKRILKLRTLDPLDAPIGPLERGTAIHRAMELFVQRYPGPLGAGAVADLIAVSEEVFSEQGVPDAVLAVWRPRFAGAATWFVKEERKRRPQIASSHVELKGETQIAPGFTLEARADRIDMLTSGRAAILDYKTGAVPAPKQVKAFLAPQLPLEAAILRDSGFGEAGEVPPVETEALVYVRLTGGRNPGEFKDIGIDMIWEITERLRQRIADFADPDSPYLPRVAPLRAAVPGDYDHLSRVREWSISGWGEDEPEVVEE
jgi:ATP-dependent helicase/nuclease subunit B